ncbi:MAG: Hint domain-containing protein [Rhodobacteraceae bacterium]|nr:Hint domain-containing protein [Paracoccaceae bacterium]
MAYTTFEFDDGTAPGSASSIAGPGSPATFVDGGVSFTFSAASGYVAHYNPSGDTGLGGFTGVPGTGTATLAVNRTPLVDNFYGTALNKIVLPISFVSGTLDITFIGAGGNQVLNNVGVGNVSATGSFDSIKFTWSGGAFGFEQMTTDFNCFLAGTLIATTDGPKPVETLTGADRLLTVGGGETPLLWLGRQSIDARLTYPAVVNPICITAHALAPGIPARDLFVTADHAVAIDGMLINVGALVNGCSVYQVETMPTLGFTYYHVETARHELILAENCAAESYLDIPSRDVFDNGAERTDAAPIPEMDMPRISAARLVPEAVRARLAARAAAIAS